MISDLQGGKADPYAAPPSAGAAAGASSSMQQPPQAMGPGNIPIAVAQVVGPSGQRYTGAPVSATVQQQQQPNVQYVVHSTTVYDNQPQIFFGSFPQRVICPVCHFDVVTGTVKEVGMISHLWAVGLCLVGCWPCCVLPYFMDACKDTAHFCPNCHSQIGYYRGI